MDLIYDAIKIITIPDIFSNKYSNYSNTFFERRNQLAVEESASEEKAAAEEEAVEEAVKEAGAAQGPLAKAEGAAQGPLAKALRAVAATVRSIAVRQAAGEKEEEEERAAAEEEEEEKEEKERAAAEKETPEERNNHDAEPNIIRGDSSDCDQYIANYLKDYRSISEDNIIKILQNWRELKEKDWINTVPVNDNPRLVELDINSEEYRIIESLYHISCDVHRGFSYRCTIERIERVHNKKAWNNFINKAIHEQRNYYCDIPLWHGTSRTDPSLIYHDDIGLKIREAINGRSYGNGIYMSLTAHYSNIGYGSRTEKNTRLQKPEAQIFLMRARVTSIRQDVYKSYRNIYVFNKESYCYPEYLISYSLF